MSDIFIGLMSGTSLDGIDAIACDFSSAPKTLATFHHPFDDDTKRLLKTLSEPGADHIDALGAAQTHLGHLFADCVLTLLEKAQLSPASVAAIGSHGQTIRHRPNSKLPFTLQIGCPNVIAVRTGIQTIADFRSADIALGGQGAPLAPAFHQAFFQAPATIVNIGGIANVTVIDEQHCFGFDTGPGNTLLDAWCVKHRNQAFDAGGAWAKQGEICPALLGTLMSEPYFKKKAPKSTGKELFNLAWLERHVSAQSAETVQATLVELTALSIAQAVLDHGMPKQLILCGGGAHNDFLCARLQAALPNHTVVMSDAFGIGVDWVEAAGFAWLAKKRVMNEALDLQSITGAKAPAKLGAIYHY